MGKEFFVGRIWFFRHTDLIILLVTSFHVIVEKLAVTLLAVTLLAVPLIIFFLCFVILWFGLLLFHYTGVDFFSVYTVWHMMGSFNLWFQF